MINEHTLETVRKFHAITQRQLGELVGVTGEYINMVERGKRPLSEGLRIKMTAKLSLTPEKLALILAADAEYKTMQKEVIG